MYPYQRTPIGNPYISPVSRGYLWVSYPQENLLVEHNKYHGTLPYPNLPTLPHVRERGPHPSKRPFPIPNDAQAFSWWFYYLTFHTNRCSGPLSFHLSEATRVVVSERANGPGELNGVFLGGGET